MISTVEVGVEIVNILLLEIKALRDDLQALKEEKKEDGRLITVKEFAERTSVSERQVRRLIANKTIPFKKVGSKPLIDYSEVVKALSVDSVRKKKLNLK